MQPRPCRSLRHCQWGFRGHTVRRSRSWSELTITHCRRRRRAHHTAEADEQPPWEWSRPMDGPMTAERCEWERRLEQCAAYRADAEAIRRLLDRKSTRLNSSHVSISYAVFCLKKKKSVSN